MKTKSLDENGANPSDIFSAHEQCCFQMAEPFPTTMKPILTVTDTEQEWRAQQNQNTAQPACSFVSTSVKKTIFFRGKLFKIIAKYMLTELEITPYC